jgi:Holliday junction resolvase RusA-like endonuclease
MDDTRIAFTVPGEPVPWKSPRIVRRGAHHAAISPDEMKEAQAIIQALAFQAMQAAGLEPLEGPVVLGIRAYRRKGMPSTQVGKDAVTAGILRPVTTPDASNLAKGCEDALSGVCFIDDAQVVRLIVEKLYSTTPRLEIVVQDWRPPWKVLVAFEARGPKWSKWLRRVFGWPL